MSAPSDDEPSAAQGRWADAVAAAALFATDPSGIGGVAVRASAGPVRDAWLALARDLLPPSAPVRRLPLNIAESRLLGGLDLAATLRGGRVVAERGLLAEADGGVVIAAMAERIDRLTAAHLAATLDRGEVALERDGIARRLPTSFGIIALDEGLEDERPPDALLDRLAFHVNLEGIGTRDIDEAAPVTRDEIAAARARLPSVRAPDEIVEALCATALSLGIGSARAPLMALRVAHAAAALDGRDVVEEDDAVLAARLVLAPRATMMPASDAPEEAPSESPEEPAEQPPDPAPDDASPDKDDAPPPDDEDDRSIPDNLLDDVVLAAAQAAIPADLLARLKIGQIASSGAKASGRAGATKAAMTRGRPAGTRRGEPRGGARLSVIETLRSAAPWQRLRREARATGTAGAPVRRIEIRADDFRIARYKERTRTTTIFVVDASGSSALHRLAEAKGAVELLLADCYVRRDQVALMVFRGTSAELLLPPTRSLARAKRSLAGLPGGGGTPLAAALDATVALADAIRRKGETPIAVILTDGRANIARDGTAGRARAGEDALAAARALRAARLTALLVDTSPMPQPQGRSLAHEMGALYLPLPQVNAALLNSAVRTVAARGANPGASAR